MNNQFKSFIVKYYLNIVFFLGLAAALGSLGFSEIAQLAPCRLCWYQRVFMYPIPILAGLALLFKDHKHVHRYILSFSVIGMAIAFYHYLIQMTDLGDYAISCGIEVTCTALDIVYFGFITIPFMSFVGFAAISILSLLYIRYKDQV